MDHEEHVRESSAKVDTIDVMMTGGLGCVYITALGAVQFHHRLTRHIGQSCTGVRYIQSCNLNQSDYSNSAFYNVDLGPGSMRYCNGKNREIEKVKASTHL